MSDRARWWLLESVTESDRRHSRLVKTAIIAIVFPTLLVTLMQPWKLVVLGLAWMLPADTAWAHWVGWCAVVLGVILPGYGALKICQLIWPKATTNSRE